jgi:hypothetical protein
VLTGARMIERGLAAPASGNSARFTTTKLVRETAITPVAGHRLAPEPSLVELIQFAPEPEVATLVDVPILPQPAGAMLAPRVPTPRPASMQTDRPAGRRRGLAIVIVSSIALGVTVTILAMREPASTTPSPVVSPNASGSGVVGPPSGSAVL